jgi:uncharacterized repeat protein (TIGR01451 family)
VGDTITYTVTLTNNGPGIATNVAVNELVPAGLSFVGATASEGGYDSAAGLWTVGTVSPGTPETLQIRATVVSPNPQTNTAGISHSDQFDPVTTNNTASTTETPQQADLALSKTVSDATPNVGDTITFTVAMTNDGPDAATGVTVQDLLPPGLTFVSATPSQGIYDNTTGAWTVGTVMTTSRPTLLIQATVASPNAQINVATISHSDQFDPNTGNNSAAATATPQQADLALTKSVSNPTPNVGDTITYTITLTDGGPDPATNVTVQDTLPAGVVFISADPSRGNFNGATGVWTVGTVTPGTPETLAITAIVRSASPGANTATVSHSDQFDPNTANNTDSSSTNPQQADLALVKTVSDSTPNVGDTVTFTVKLTNTGPSAATNVQVTDLLPAGLTFVSDTPSPGTYDPATGLWTVGTLANGAQATLALQAHVVVASARSNTATITHADQFDPNAGNNTGSATVRPQRADLALTKTVDDPTPNVGDAVTFTVTLTDRGPDTATNVTVQDLLPAGLTFVSASPSQGTYNSTTGAWAVGTVTTATPQTLQIHATVASPAAQTNTASISHSDQFDPLAGNNTSTATVTPQQADLALSKAVSNPTPNVGDTVTYTVTLSNLGPDAATNVAVEDLLPAGLNFASVMPSLGSYNSGTGLWSVGTLAGNTNVTLVVQATVASPGVETNTVTINHSDQFDPNTANSTASTTVTPQQSDLAVSKSVSDPTPNVGDTITFTVTLTNNGPDPATTVSVADPLPAGLDLVAAAPSQGSYNPITGVWTVGTVNAGTPQTLQLQALVVSAGAQTNTATIAHSDQFDPNAANNQASATETPQQADLALAKTVDNASPNVGDTVTFTVTLTNNGPDPATGVTIHDLLPSGLTFVSATPSQGTYDSSAGTWVVGTVTSTTLQTLQIQAKVVSPAARTNTATISHADQFDPDAGNNTAGATETPQQADLQVTKSVSNPTPNVGDTITYTITVRNGGPDPATAVSVEDTLPAGLAFMSATPSQGTYDSATGLWTVGTVAVGTPQTLTITATVQSPNPDINTAAITHSDQFDPNTTNNTATTTANPQQSDLAVLKSVDQPRPNVGDTVTFTVTLSNTGPNDATSVTVTDPLPPGLQFAGATASEGTYDSTTGLWTVGTVTSDMIETLQIRAMVVSPDAHINTAAVFHSDQFDPDPGNNTGSATATPQQADLQLTKVVSNPTPNVGDTVTFTVTVNDLGPDSATNVQVADLLPAGLTFVSASPSQGTYNSTTGVWTVPSIDPSAAQTLTLTATVVSPNPQTNTGSISHSDQFDPDTTNNTASVTGTPQQADLKLSKSVSDATPNVGDIITYTVTLNNLGPDSATNVQVTDLVPTGLTFVSAAPSQGTYNSASGVWTLGTVTPSAQATLQVRATAVSSSAQTNTASITHSDQFDPTPGNDSAGTTETPQQADLALTKTVGNPSPNVGDTVTYTITLTNSGPDTATNVAINDLLPPGLQFLSATPSQGTYNSATGVWAVGTVPTGTPQRLQLQARVLGPAAQTNTASITHSDQFDATPGNNSASTTETPQQADLHVAKSVSNPTPNVGDTIAYTVTLSNNGPDPATTVAVLDTLPAGVAFVSSMPSQGTYNAATGVWNVGTVSPGAPQTLVITVTVQSPNPQANTATITHADQFDSITTNNSSSSEVTPQQSDLALSKTVDNLRPNVGNTITFTVTLTNNGPNSATDVQVIDPLPLGLTFVSAAPGQGSYDSGTGVWTVGTLASGARSVLTIQAKVASPIAQTNTATIRHADQFDPDTSNNSASTTETPQQADLALAKMVSNTRPNVGDTITYTVTLTNLGFDPATGVRVLDALPAGLSFVSADPSQGTYDPATGLWSVGSVAIGSPQTLVVQATVKSPSPQTNTATISHSDQFDEVTANNTTSTTATPQQADLALSKSVDDSTPHVGDTITFTVTLNNNGPDPATNVRVADSLPSGLSFVSARPSQGTYDSGTGLWSVGTVNLGVPETLVILARVDSPGSETNTATIAHADQFDQSPGNNSSSVVVTTSEVPSIAPPSVTLLQRFGYHAQPTLFLLTFSSALDPTRAQDLGNYQLTLIAHGGRLHRSLRLTGAVYNAANHSVTLDSAKLLPLKFQYMLVVNGTSSTGVAGQSGILLDGNGDGVPGGNYVRGFGRDVLAGPNPMDSRRGHVLVHRSPPGHTPPVRLSVTKATHPASAGKHHSDPGSSVARQTRVGLHPSLVDAVLGSIVERPRR